MRKWNVRAVSMLFWAIALSACGDGQTIAAADTVEPNRPADISVKGTVLVQSAPSEMAGTARPARHITVALVGSAGTVLATGITDENGRYALLAPVGQTAVLRTLAIVQLTVAAFAAQPDAAENSPRLFVDSLPFTIGADTADRSDTVPLALAAPFDLLDRVVQLQAGETIAANAMAAAAAKPAESRLYNTRPTPDSVNVGYRSTGRATIGQPYPVKIMLTDVGMKGARLTFKSDPALNLTQAEPRTMPAGSSSITVMATPTANGRFYFTVYARSGTAAFVIPVPVQVGPPAPEVF